MLSGECLFHVLRHSSEFSQYRIELLFEGCSQLRGDGVENGHVDCCEQLHLVFEVAYYFVGRAAGHGLCSGMVVQRLWALMLRGDSLRTSDVVCTEGVGVGRHFGSLLSTKTK
jgi:hypothetical protein